LLTPKRSPAKKPEKVAAKADTEDKKIAVKVKSQDDTKEKKKAEKPTPKAPTTPTLESTKRKRSPTPPPNPETAEQKKARKLKAAEGMVLDILGDAEFLELTELVGEVWQRMGLQNVGGIWSRDSS
jgi:hypothetical protein